jgi:NTP pyrophosphatase (non-canonical NTP hydrolase)
MIKEVRPGLRLHQYWGITPVTEKEFDFHTFSQRHAVWINHNFPTTTPWEQVTGVMEEAGELAHAILKRQQGIRGTKEALEAEMQDAIGDLLIYSNGVCRLQAWPAGHIILDTIEAFTPKGFDIPRILARINHSQSELMINHVGNSLSTCQKAVQELVHWLCELCHLEGWNIIEILATTWHGVVEKRDWRERPNGG